MLKKGDREEVRSQESGDRSRKRHQIAKLFWPLMHADTKLREHGTAYPARGPSAYDGEPGPSAGTGYKHPCCFVLRLGSRGFGNVGLDPLAQVAVAGKGSIRLRGFSRPAPCVPNDQRSASDFYRSKEQIVKGWDQGEGQENSCSFYRACDHVRPAICSWLEHPSQDSHRNRDLQDYCPSQPRSLSHMWTTTVCSLIRVHEIK